ncbi:hypothetical protein ACQP1V_36135 [Microtetraspora malaysiensis]|uniref:hypothetical protein n=1 Tax=Microtetraspora malaysiensis TaxID=161358 RepID=UPI003D9249D6
MTLTDLVERYGSDWVIRDVPSPSATRKRQLDDSERKACRDLTMNLWAADADDLGEQLAEQEWLLETIRT